MRREAKGGGKARHLQHRMSPPARPTIGVGEAPAAAVAQAVRGVRPAETPDLEATAEMPSHRDPAVEAVAAAAA
eukprot:gene9956-22245_t